MARPDGQSERFLFSPHEYLENFHVLSYIEDAIAMLLSSQLEATRSNPVEFMASYFSSGMFLFSLLISMHIICLYLCLRVRALIPFYSLMRSLVNMGYSLLLFIYYFLQYNMDTMLCTVTTLT